MDIKIITQEKNPFLKRQELKFEIKEIKKMPLRKEIREKIAALINAKEETLVINKISHKFGSHNVLGEARSYDSKDTMETTEQKYVLKRNFKEKKKTEKEEKKENPSQKQKEEKKEQPKEQKEDSPKKDAEQKPQAKQKEAPKGKNSK